MSQAVCWVIFGPDLEPLESDARRMAAAPGPRRDGLRVAGEAGEVAERLVAAPGWCRLEQVAEDGARYDVHVQSRHVRFVVADAPAQPARAGGSEPPPHILRRESLS